ncbi:MAG TPA: hypothetical protein VJ933_00705 [Phaeodactylibacter sp.]|nr:hypothetical protein [Phaeodactylibacter sp.]
MKERDDIQQELEKLSPELAKLRQQSEPKTGPPSGYFDNLADRVLERASGEDKPPLDIVWRGRSHSKRQWRTGWAVAAALLLVLSASLYIFSPSNRPAVSLAELSDAEARAYIEGNIDEFGINLMLEAELVHPDEQALPADMILDLQEEDIEEYLYEIMEDEELEELF